MKTCKRKVNNNIESDNICLEAPPVASRETLGNDFFSQLTDFAAGQGFIGEVDVKQIFYLT